MLSCGFIVVALLCAIICHVVVPSGIDEDDSVPEASGDAPSTDDMPPLEGDEDDASRMEEVD